MFISTINRITISEIHVMTVLMSMLTTYVIISTVIILVVVPYYKPTFLTANF